MAYVVIRPIDNAVVGVNSTQITLDPGYVQIEKNPPPDFRPHWQEIMWTYNSILDQFINTGLPMTW